jgi:glycine/serine hydroxymethyltransferase
VGYIKMMRTSMMGMRIGKIIIITRGEKKDETKKLPNMMSKSCEDMKKKSLIVEKTQAHSLHR